jgi:hypothetical protein
VQNAYHAAVLEHPEALKNGQDTERAGEFRRLGERLNFNLDRLRTPTGTPG